MKKLAIVLAAAAFLLSAATANAQLYFGGSLGYTSSTYFRPAALTGNGDLTITGSAYKFVPEVGYRINSRMAVGGRLGYGTGADSFGDIDPNDMNGIQTAIAGINADGNNANSITTSFTFAPYFRYTIFDGRRLSFFVDAVAGFGNQANKTKDANGVWQDGGKLSFFQLGAKPGFQLSFDNHFSVIGHLGFLGYQSVTNTQDSRKWSRVGASLSSNSITLGFLYSL